MMRAPNSETLRREIAAVINAPVDGVQTLSGSSFERVLSVTSESKTYFVKTGSHEARLKAELDGLRALSDAGAVRVPQPVALKRLGDMTYLVTEFIELHAPRAGSFDVLARKLAAQHRITGDWHGWRQDNYIGATEQPNSPNPDWRAFFMENRLRHQLRLARDNGYRGDLQSLGEKLMAHSGALFACHAPEASLLHGDLWRGNCGFDVHGEPVIFDPATYFGDRETDIAMTRLFGGFSQRFYDAYQETWPLPDGSEQRAELYSLYHLLNHLNLFGGQYLGQCESTLRRLLGAVR